jgi:hypothetical protein
VVSRVFKFILSKPVLLAILVGVLVIRPAAADELADLKMQLQELAKRVEILEQKRNQRRQQNIETENLAIDHVETDPNLRGTWQIPGTDTSLGVSGFVRAHMIYDIGPRPTSGGGDVASIHRSILEDTPEFENRGDVRIAGRDARFNIETFTPSTFGKIHTFLQTDFKGDPDEKASRAGTNRTVANLRHAYAEIGNFLFGHTYSAYLDNTVFGDKVDPTGPQGRTMIRQTQIRYTHHFDDEREWAFAIENPHADFVDADDDNLHDGYPDLAMHYRHETDRWMYQFGAMVRRMGIKQVEPFPADDEVFSWGLNTSGRYWFPNQRNRITWYLNFGDGIGRYLEAGRDQGASITPDGKLDTQFGYGGFVTFKHFWTDTLSSNFDLGMGFYDLNPDEDPEANKKLISSHMNLVWTPFSQVEMGLEYVWGRREVHDGRVGKVNRLVVNTQFNF